MVADERPRPLSALFFFYNALFVASTAVTYKHESGPAASTRKHAALVFHAWCWPWRVTTFVNTCRQY
jgi:hypothetical protein